MMSQGDLTILVNRPISGTLLAVAALVLCLPLLRKVRAGASMLLSGKNEDDRSG